MYYRVVGHGVLCTEVLVEQDAVVKAAVSARPAAKTSYSLTTRVSGLSRAPVSTARKRPTIEGKRGGDRSTQQCLTQNHSQPLLGINPGCILRVRNSLVRHAP